MKLIISHALITASGAATEEILKLLGADAYEQVDPALIPEINTKHYSVQHDALRTHVSVEISDAAILRGFALYIKVAKFLGPILKACLAFCDEMKQEMHVFSQFMLEE